MKPRTNFLIAFGALALSLSVARADAAGPENFASPVAAKDRFVAAVRSHDAAALKSILGPSADDLLYSGDSVEDARVAKQFLAALDQRSNLDEIDARRTVLLVGNDNWAFPIPIVKRASGWQFDAAAGKDEILARRIGRNELQAVQACLAFVDAQREYASTDHGDGTLEYAQRFVSSDGKRDGLYWPAKDGDPQSPLGP
ncbi:MAG TPA: DUF2950 family protein, partial [Rhizomicrobium sp.]|nr:DUF2950 family protein [Rhizomicrobium sp.]